jgi:hypothetical protein
LGLAYRIQLKDLLSDRFLREIHHLLWMAPSLAQDRMDAGWNCRDHAWVTALLLRSFGHRSTFFHGEAFFVRGQTGNAAGVSYDQRPHTWIFVESVGAIDLSVKPAFSISGDDFRIPISGVFANEAMPRGRSKAYFLTDAAAYARAAEDLPKRRNQVSAVYLLSEAEHLHEGHLTRAAGWIGSALTGRLHAAHGNPSDLYAALLLHLRSILDGSAASLSGLSFEQAWARLAGARKGAIERARQCIEAVAGARWSPLPQGVRQPAIGQEQVAGAS